MEPPAKAPRLAPRRSARLQNLQPPPPPPPLLQNLRCAPANARKPCWFAVLPVEVLLRVFAALPADARAACARVCAPWREALLRGADAWRCWTRLDLSYGRDAACTRNDAALAGAAALARGHLLELHLSSFSSDRITLDALLGVLRGSPELAKLTLGGGLFLKPDLLRQVAAASPTLQQLDIVTGVDCDSSADSLPLLRAEPPYGPLRMRLMSIDCGTDYPDDDIGGVAGARRFGAAVAHSWVRELSLSGVSWIEPAALEALADALLARTCRVEKLELWSTYDWSPAYLPAFARLLAGRDGAALTEVRSSKCQLLFDGAAAADVEAVCAALRRTTLTRVNLFDFQGMSTSNSRGEWLSKRHEAALTKAAAANPRLQLNL